MAVFEAGGEEVIPWKRILDFQVVVLKQIAAKMLHASPIYGNSPHPPEVYIPGDIAAQAFGFFSGVRVYVSVWNPGAVEMAEELRETWQEQWGGQGRFEILVTDYRPSFDTEGGASWEGDVDEREHPSERESDGGVYPATPERLAMPPHATHFLLYLSGDTFTGFDGQKLAQEVRRARAAARVPIVLVHETDPRRSGCAFDRLFHTTPEDLINGGLYKKIAVPCQPEPLRSVSLALVARAFGAAPVKQRFKRFSMAPRALLESMSRPSIYGSSRYDETSMRVGRQSVVRVEGNGNGNGNGKGNGKRHRVRHAAPAMSCDAPAFGDLDEITLRRTMSGSPRRTTEAPPALIRKARSSGDSPLNKGPSFQKRLSSFRKLTPREEEMHLSPTKD